jgi:hypothetical protein
LFGNAAQPPAGSLFAQAPAGSLFGAAPAGFSLFGKPADGQPSLFSNTGNLFAKPVETKQDEDNEDDGPIKADDEPPSYAIEGQAANSSAIKIAPSPYTKTFEVSSIPDLIQVEKCAKIENYGP